MGWEAESSVQVWTVLGQALHYLDLGLVPSQQAEHPLKLFPDTTQRKTLPCHPVCGRVPTG